MKKIDFLIRSLYNRSLSSSELTSLYYEECQEDIDIKRQYYADKGKEMTESQLKSQIRAEISSTFYDRKTGNVIEYFTISEDRPHLYSLTEEGRIKYKELFDEDIESTIIDEPIINDVHETENKDDIGIVYLLKSGIHKDTYKIGITNREIDDRVNDLYRDRTYGSYLLKPLLYIKLKNYNQVEQVSHKFFENFRLCKKNDIFIDTELFKTDINLFEEFKYFLKVNFLDHPRLKYDVLEYREY
jgi:hypothetical protein